MRKAPPEELAPEILEVVVLVAEILLDQWRRQTHACDGGASRAGASAQDDKGKAA